MRPGRGRSGGLRGQQLEPRTLPQLRLAYAVTASVGYQMEVRGHTDRRVDTGTGKGSMVSGGKPFKTIEGIQRALHNRAPCEMTDERLTTAWQARVLAANGVYVICVQSYGQFNAAISDRKKHGSDLPGFVRPEEAKAAAYMSDDGVRHPAQRDAAGAWHTAKRCSLQGCQSGLFIKGHRQACRQVGM